jgi:ATP-binding cassette subfamily C protein
VLTSYSVQTLVGFSILAVGFYLIQGVLEVIRSQILVRIGIGIDRRLMPPAQAVALRMPLAGASSSDAMQPTRDVDTIRAFVGSQGPGAILDLPWFPIYLIFVFLLHPWLGMLSSVGVLLLIALTLASERATGRLERETTAAFAQRHGAFDGNTRNAEVIRAMGFADRAQARVNSAHAALLGAHVRAADLSGTLSGVSRVLRMILQSAVLGLGAYLTIKGQLTAGAIIAASIASARALAPIELSIAHWKGFVSARQAYGRLTQHLAQFRPDPKTIDLAPPRASLKLDGVTVAPPGSQRPVVANVSLELKAGQACGIIGPSAAGKSTLARAIVGVWPLQRGSVRLDNASLDQWSVSAIGRHVGYLPQAVELFDGSIAENIARLDPTASADAVVAAAKAADCHDMIVRLPGGYQAKIGTAGAALSGGQRQRIGLARALFGNPFLVVLDEPNSNLDAEGDTALARAVQNVRSRGGIVIMVAHRPSALSACDMAACISAGQLTAFGPRDDVLRKVLRVA